MASIDAAAQGNGVIARAVNEIKNNDAFANGQVAILATDMKTGEVLASVNPDMSVIPASNTKLFTTAAALELLGADYTYKTELVYTGNIDSTGLLKGDTLRLVRVSSPTTPITITTNFSSKPSKRRASST